jgi:hypothetical protein
MRFHGGFHARFHSAANDLTLPIESSVWVRRRAGPQIRTISSGE